MERPCPRCTSTHIRTQCNTCKIRQHHCTRFGVVAPAVELRILAQGEFRPRSLACLLGEFVHCRRACAPSNGAFPCSWRVHSSSHSITTPNLHIECLEHARCAHSPCESDQGLAGNGFALIGRALVPAVQQRSWVFFYEKKQTRQTQLDRECSHVTSASSRPNRARSVGCAARAALAPAATKESFP